MMRASQSLPVLAAASFATLGCAGAALATKPGAEPEQAPARVVRETPPTPATTPVRASFEYAAGTVSYVVTSEATIAEIDSVASAPRTFHEVARVNATIVPAGGYAVVTTTGSVESTTAASIIQPFTDTLRVASMDSIAEPRMPICGRDTVPPMHLIALLPPVPQELIEGMRWQRRHTYAICQGSIPVRVERTDRYRVTGRGQRIAGNGVTLSRSSSLAYDGAGVEGQHNVRVTGSGSAQATLVLDVSASRLVSAVEESTSKIDITASGRTRRFSQRVINTVTDQ